MSAVAQILKWNLAAAKINAKQFPIGANGRRKIACSAKSVATFEISKIWTWREHGLPENEFQRAFDQAEALHLASGHLDAWRMPSKIQCSGANSSE